MRPHSFAYENPLGVAARKFKNVFIHQTVIKNHICFLQPFNSAQRQQVARAGAGANKRDMPRLLCGIRWAAGSDRRLDVLDRFAFSAAHPFRAGRAFEHPGPKCAALLPWHISRNTRPQAPGERRKPAKHLRQHALQRSFDLTGEHRRGAFAADGHHNRIPVHNGRGDHVAQIRLVNHVHRAPRGPGQRLSGCIHSRTASSDESHAGGFKDLTCQFSDMARTARLHHLLQFIFKLWCDHNQISICLQQQPHLLRGLLSAANNDNSASCGAYKHGKGFHEICLSSCFFGSVFLPKPLRFARAVAEA